MGNSSSSHQPLERGFTRGTFGDIKNVVGIKFQKNNFLSADKMKILRASLAVFLETKLLLLFFFCNPTHLSPSFVFIHRRHLHSVAVKDPQRKWIDFANHSAIHFEGAKIVCRKHRSHINGSLMKPLCGRQRVSSR